MSEIAPSILAEISADVANSTPEKAVQALHARCGIYTRPEIARRILDSVGWRSNANLAKFRLLEPAAGDGIFVVEAAKRLIRSLKRQSIPLRFKTLADRIIAFELHPGEALMARLKVFAILIELGVHPKTAMSCARRWVTIGDFLLADVPKGITHAVGNPPYVRWSKIPSRLKEKYERNLSKEMIGGDLFLPFLDRALMSLVVKGRCGFLCSDRWRFMAFAEGFRKKWLPLLKIESTNVLSADMAFVESVDSYPAILVASKRRAAKDMRSRGIRARSGKTLAELGYTIRVGPALGHTPAFTLGPNEKGVETSLLKPWIDSSEIKEGVVAWQGTKVVTMYGNDGKLIELKKFPRLHARLKKFKDKLSRRSIVTKGGAPWYRTIDRTMALHWIRPKLLVPEIAKVPCIAIDRSGAIPAHGVYVIFAPDDNVEALYELLRDGQLAKALNGLAPKVKGGYVRCYKRFLEKVRIPVVAG